jgi:hypothetical protein
MAGDVPATVFRQRVAPEAVVLSARVRSLRTLVAAAGIGSAALFLVVALYYRLQEYADGSMFSYAIAVEDVWAFHWHNISGRLFVFLAIQLPAEIAVALTHDVGAGVALYGFLFFSAQLAGLIATWAADRSNGRTFFYFACVSTACFCPLVFGFPTEMWVAHALFWPTLAVCHYARNSVAGAVLVAVMLVALSLTHEAALILAGVIVFTTLLRGDKAAAFRRSAGAFVIALAVWTLVKLTLPPDDYDGPMMWRVALHFFDPSILTSYLLVLLSGALAGYGIAYVALRRLIPPPSTGIAAAGLIGLALAVYWLWIDHALHAEQRYHLRTVQLITTAGLGLLAAAYALKADGRLKLYVPLLSRAMSLLAGETTVGAIPGAIVLILLVHVVETAKFCLAWKDYAAAVQALAMGKVADPALGNASFVSSARIGPDLNRLSWFSTTPYLSVLVAPGYTPARLVVDPTATYFWLTCATAKANEEADRAVPAESRRLVRLYACLHR